MITEKLSTLKINKLTQAQYDRELEAGRIDENALYLTPDEEAKPVIAESTDGINYTVTVPWVTELYTGLSITIIPEISATTNVPKVSVNGLGEYSTLRRASDSAILNLAYDGSFRKGVPVTLTFYNHPDDYGDNDQVFWFWIAEGITRPSKGDIVDTICESGTWTPTLVSGADSLTGFSDCTYHKTGNIVTVSILCWGTFTNRNSDAITFSLPYRVASKRIYGMFGYTNAGLTDLYLAGNCGAASCSVMRHDASGNEVGVTGTGLGRDNWTFQCCLTYGTDE